ncbi:MAG: 30S ribosomal protein S4 [Bacteroidia bacterium]|nr:30S ribosomal protein S4 [Bacteroidia bacterium]
MARYTGPKSKIARRFREPIFGPDKHLEKKNYPPGMHGVAKKRMKQSEYALQLQEKQKAKYTYGVLERQFRKIFADAHRAHGITGQVLLQYLEARLDNVVYRMGIAPSRRAARQLVSHCHILVNGEILNVPSHRLKPGDEISIREKSRSLEVIANNATSSSKYPWMNFEPKEFKGTFLNLPEREQIPENIKELLIVELYSR